MSVQWRSGTTRRSLGLTHFVDGHPEVHAAVRGAVDHQYLFGPQRHAVPPYAQAAPTWAVAEELIRDSLAAARSTSATGPRDPSRRG